MINPHKTPIIVGVSLFLVFEVILFVNLFSPLRELSLIMGEGGGSQDRVKHFMPRPPFTGWKPFVSPIQYDLNFKHPC